MGRASIKRNKENIMENQAKVEVEETEISNEEPQILDEIQIEELAIDGICGVY